MADIGRQEDFVFRFTRHDQFAIVQQARAKVGVDDNTVSAGPKRLALPLGNAEAPSPAVIGGHIGNGIGLVGQRIEVRLQFVTFQPDIGRLGISDEVKIVLSKIHDPVAVTVEDIGIPDRPFVRYRPVEGLRARRDRTKGEPRQFFPDPRQGLAEPRPGDRAGDRPKLARERMAPCADIRLAQSRPHRETG